MIDEPFSFHYLLLTQYESKEGKELTMLPPIQLLSSFRLLLTTLTSPKHLISADLVNCASVRWAISLYKKLPP